MAYTFRQAGTQDASAICAILEKAIQRRKEDGSSQWQDGYPNLTVVQNDIQKGAGYVLMDANTIIGYAAILISDEPEYANLKGNWITHGAFVVYHRVAIAEDYLGQGLAQHLLLCIEKFALENNIYSIKADTNFDNAGMLRIFEKSGYSYCGEVTFRGSPRKAFEKVLKSKDQ